MECLDGGAASAPTLAQHLYDSATGPFAILDLYVVDEVYKAVQGSQSRTTWPWLIACIVYSRLRQAQASSPASEAATATKQYTVQPATSERGWNCNTVLSQMSEGMLHSARSCW
jgi:hypothetical protein